MKNLKSFEIKFLGATNTQGSRVKIHDILRNESIIIPWDYNFYSSLEIAISYLQKKNINIIGTSELKNSYIILTDNFKDRIK